MGTRCKMMSTPENTRKTEKFGPSFFPAEILYKRLWTNWSNCNSDYLTRMKEQRNIFFCGFSYFHWFLWQHLGLKGWLDYLLICSFYTLRHYWRVYCQCRPPPNIYLTMMRWFSRNSNSVSSWWGIYNYTMLLLVCLMFLLWLWHIVSFLRFYIFIGV